MVELKEKRLRKSLSEAKNEWQGQKDSNPRHAVLETVYPLSTTKTRLFFLYLRINNGIECGCKHTGRLPYRPFSMPINKNRANNYSTKGAERA